MISRRLSPAWIAVLAGFLFLLSMRDAYAYIDPGTGSYMLQTALGVALAAAFAIKVSWLKIKERVARALRRESDGSHS